MLTTLDSPGTKSTVTASSPSGTDSVAVSPVSSTSARSCGPREVAHVEPREHAVGERDEVQPEPVRPAAGLALDQAAALERREQPRGAARVDADPPRQRVDARGPLGQRVEQRERARDGADRPAAVVAHPAEASALRRRARARGRRAACAAPTSRSTSIIAAVAGER